MQITWKGTASFLIETEEECICVDPFLHISGGKYAGEKDIIYRHYPSDLAIMRSIGDLKAKYKALQGCLEIQEWSNNTGGGRGNEHYFVRGI